jgi:hypothetical protein
MQENGPHAVKETFRVWAVHSLLHVVDPTKLAAFEGISFIGPHLLRIDNFVAFQLIFLRLNNQVDAREWPSLDQKRLSWFGPGIPFSMWTRPSLLHPKTSASLTPFSKNQ